MTVMTPIYLRKMGLAMMVDSNTKLRAISAKISKEELALAKAYIQGAVHGHCNNSADKALSVRILFGGDNRDWGGTPLQCIYNYHEQSGSDNPVKVAAQDVGWLLKCVLKEDARTFKYVGESTGSEYKFVV